MRKANLQLSFEEAQLVAGDDAQEWRVKGYATKFGNLNSYGFKIGKGAYEKLIAAGVQPLMFYNHLTHSQVPLGRWESLAEDSRGLKVEGVMTQGVSMASDVYAALKAGTLNGLSVSIGWAEEDMAFDAKGAMTLTQIRSLDEISIVTYPSDSKARVTETLSADEIDDRIEKIETVRDLESFFRSTVNLSKRQSGWLLSKAKTCFASETDRDGPLEVPDRAQLLALQEKLKALNNSL